MREKVPRGFSSQEKKERKERTVECLFERLKSLTKTYEKRMPKFRIQRSIRSLFSSVRCCHTSAPPPTDVAIMTTTRMNMFTGINDAMRVAMKADENVILFGEVSLPPPPIPHSAVVVCLLSVDSLKYLRYIIYTYRTLDSAEFFAVGNHHPINLYSNIDPNIFVT